MVIYFPTKFVSNALLLAPVVIIMPVVLVPAATSSRLINAYHVRSDAANALRLPDVTSVKVVTSLRDNLVLSPTATPFPVANALQMGGIARCASPITY